MRRILALVIICCLFALPVHAEVTGSVSLANIRLSLVNGTAFVDFSAVDTLTPYLNRKLILTDSAGKKAVGYIKAAGTGETYGDETIANGGFDSDTTGWGVINGTIASVAGGQSGNCLELTMTGGTYQAATSSSFTPILGDLYKFDTYVKSGTSGNSPFQISIGGSPILFVSGTSTESWVETVGYKASIVSNSTKLYVMKNNAVAGTMLFDTISLKQVLSPSATGVTITSTRGGTTYNWESIETEFNYNDTGGYTYVITNRKTGKGAKALMMGVW